MNKRVMTAERAAQPGTPVFVVRPAKGREDVYCMRCAYLMERKGRMTRGRDVRMVHEYFDFAGGRLYDCPRCGAALSLLSTTTDYDQTEARRAARAVVTTATVPSVPMEQRLAAFLEGLGALPGPLQADVMLAAECLLAGVARANRTAGVRDDVCDQVGGC